MNYVNIYCNENDSECGLYVNGELKWQGELDSGLLKKIEEHTKNTENAISVFDCLDLDDLIDDEGYVLFSCKESARLACIVYPYLRKLDILNSLSADEIAALMSSTRKLASTRKGNTDE